LAPGGLDILRRELLPLAGWVTPNWAELAVLSGLPVASLGQAEAAMHQLGALHPHLTVVATGGDQARPIDQLRLPDGTIYLFEAERIETKSTHGTGCAFSSSLLCRLLALLRSTSPRRSGARRASDTGTGR
jgi:hydroxymethylpyrimidine/phosphomethylpyrimidine kinase